MFFSSAVNKSEEFRYGTQYLWRYEGVKILTFHQSAPLLGTMPQSAPIAARTARANRGRTRPSGAIIGTHTPHESPHRYRLHVAAYSIPWCPQQETQSGSCTMHLPACDLELNECWSLRTSTSVRARVPHVSRSGPGDNTSSLRRVSTSAVSCGVVGHAMDCMQLIASTAARNPPCPAA